MKNKLLLYKDNKIIDITDKSELIPDDAVISCVYDTYTFFGEVLHAQEGRSYILTGVFNSHSDGCECAVERSIYLDDVTNIKIHSMPEPWVQGWLTWDISHPDDMFQFDEWTLEYFDNNGKLQEEIFETEELKITWDGKPIKCWVNCEED